MRGFEHITDWIFDLDNTLYPHSCNLFSQIDLAMTQYVIELTGYDFDTARNLQKELYRDHGTTLKGLMATRDVDPEHYLSAVHDIDYSPVSPHPELVSTIAGLPGRKFIFTNADINHAEAVLARLGGAEIFDGMFDIKGADYQPKPQRSAYEKCLATFDIRPNVAVMFDDLEQNLRVPHDLGMRTVQILPGDIAYADPMDERPAQTSQSRHVDHTTDNLPVFLSKIASSVS